MGGGGGRPAVFRVMKKQKAEFDFINVMADAENINNIKGNTQTALAVKKASKLETTKQKGTNVRTNIVHHG